MKTSITWYGQSAFEIKTGDQNLIIDPYFNGNALSPIKADQLEKADYLAVTHGHADHFGDTMEIMRRHPESKLICTTMISWYLQLRGFRREDGRNVSMGQGGTVKAGEMSVSMVNAIHPTALFGDEWPELRQFHMDGGAVGYVVRTGDVSIYHAGDTDVFMDMQLIERRYHPDIAILPVGGRFTMDLDSAILACEMLKPKILIPMHYNNAGGMLVCDMKELAEKLAKVLPDTRLVQLSPGETFVYGEN